MLQTAVPTSSVDGASQHGPFRQLGTDEARHTGTGVDADAYTHRVRAVGHQYLQAACVCVYVYVHASSLEFTLSFRITTLR